MLLLLSIGIMGFGILTASKGTQATGFMAGVMAVALLYYSWVSAREEPRDVEP